MKRHYWVLALALISGLLYSCKKDSKNTTTLFGPLIVGKWSTTKQHMKVYTTAGALVKDTTIVFTVSGGTGWFETFNSDGSGCITTQTYNTKSKSKTPVTDTTLTYIYKVSGSNLALYEYGDLKSEDDYTIVSVSSTIMQQEATYLGLPDSGWGLDVNTQYNFTEDDYYTKQ
jgi:hypothetical protein